MAIDKMEKRKEDKWTRIGFLIIVLVVGTIVVINIFNYPKDYECYNKQCVEYNTDSCEIIGYERVGFMAVEIFYDCDGMKVAKRCSNYEDVKQDIKPNIFDILTSKCTKLESSP